MWEMILKMTIPGPPVPMGRPRYSKWGMYTPPKSKKWMKIAQERIAIKWLNTQLETEIPVKLVAQFIHKRPKNRYRKKDPDERYFKTTSPDLDNLEKILLDSIVYARVMKDDSQVVAIESLDYYGAKDEEPHVEFELWIYQNEILNTTK